MNKTTLNFETLSFRLSKDNLVVTLLNLFQTKIPVSELEKISSFSVEKNAIIFDSLDSEKVEMKFDYLLQKYLKNLHTKLTGNKATYIHRNSGIPLIGNVAFGIVYRGSSIIEIKTNNGCNLDCVYCSISEGLSSKQNDFVVEKDYLIEELQKLITFVGEPVEVHIGVQGEPFLYGDMENLIEDLQNMQDVHTISIDTNGTLLTTEKIDSLSKCDKLQYNLSLDAIDSDTAKKVAGVKNYNIEHVKKIISHAAKKNKVIVAPVMTKGFNIEEMENIINWVKSLEVQPTLGIQNFLRYKTGRNIAKEIPWNDFYQMLEKLEKKHDIKLRLSKDDFNVKKTKTLPKPFFETQEVNAVIKCVGRFPNSVIAVAGERSITIPNCKYVEDKKIKIKITRDKHNVYTGKLV